MNKARGLLVLCFPVASVVALASAAFYLRSVPETAGVRSGQRGRDAAGSTVARVPTSPLASAPRPVLNQKPASSDEAASASDLARVRGTYRNFRTAIAQGNLALQGMLTDALRPNRGAALKMAQEDLVQARTDTDRDIAARTLEALRRSP